MAWSVYIYDGKRQTPRGDRGKEMKKEFVKCADRRTARNRCPWAAVIIKAGGGYWCFESVNDARIWAKQK